MPKLSKHNAALKRASFPRARIAARMRARGATWTAIGKALGVTRQRARQLAAKINGG